MIIAMVLIVLAVLSLIAYPLFRVRVGRKVVLDDTEDELGELVKRKEASYTALKELEFDYHTGKLSDEDYRELCDVYKSEALQAIRTLEEGDAAARDSIEAEVENEIRSRRRRLPGQSGGKGASQVLCPACGGDNEEGSSFCSDCGAPLGEKCRKCGALNDPAAQYCSECGLRLGKRCPKCGHYLEEEALFCSRCGAALTVPEKKRR